MGLTFCNEMPAIVGHMTAGSASPAAALISGREAVASWPQRVIRRIESSQSPDPLLQEAGTHLSPSVALSAAAFFDGYGAALENEPHIYASREGNLLADFGSGDHQFTISVTPMKIRVLSTTDGLPTAEYFQPGEPRLRERLMQLRNA